LVRRAEQSKYNLESIDRMMAVISALEGAQDQPLEQVARTAGLSDATALRYLLSLSKHDFVERDPRTGTFRLGLRLFRLGALAIDGRDIVGIARPAMEQLLRTFGESVNLGARQASSVVLISVLDSPNPVRKGSRVGETDVWHATSLGKALLGAMTDDEAADVLAASALNYFTPNTITTVDGLQREMQAIRSRGYSIDDEEAVEGLRCVGAAILDHDGVASYALSVSGPKSRMTYSRIQEIGEALAKCAAELSAQMGHRHPS
jgi:DNA-binding IclR family transcriptional regulator